MEILDETLHDEGRGLLKIKKQERILYKVTLGLFIFNCIAYIYGEGFYQKSIGFVIGSLFGLFIWGVLGGLVLGVIISLFPFDSLTYRQKFKRAYYIGFLITSLLISFAAFVTILNKIPS